MDLAVFLGRLNNCLLTLKSSRGLEGSLTFPDLVSATRALMHEHEAEVPKRVAGAKLSRLDAAHQAEVLTRFYKVVRELERGSNAEIEAVRTEAESR